MKYDKRPLKDLSEEERQEVAERIAELVRPTMERIGAVPLSEYQQLREELGATHHELPIDELPIDEVLKVVNRFEAEQRSRNEQMVEALRFVLNQINPQNPPAGAAAPGTAKGNESKRRRGGPLGTPEEKKLEIVREWHEVQGDTSQEIFCNSRGISSSTLRRWEKELKAQGKF